MKSCPQCGKTFEDSFKICPHDGVKLPEAAPASADPMIGRLLAGLGPQLARTNVLFAGDNGTPPEVTVPPFLPTHAKGTPYDGSVHVPLIAAGPAVAGGRDEPALVSLVDVFATVAELAGIDAAAAAPPWVAQRAWGSGTYV